jgi:3-deoxy-D-manno-octulosonate 8-phosphate phosphatase (KDO 8-P phosphatase)
MIENNRLRDVQLVAFDFDGVFTDNRVITTQDGTESVSCWRSDGIGISRLNTIGIKTVIISTETNPVVKIRAEKLKIQCYQAIEDKSAKILELCENYNISTKNTMFVGNDINDIPAFKSVGMPVGVQDSYLEIEPYILFKTNKLGGYGAVREICDLIYFAKTMK